MERPKALGDWTARVRRLVEQQAKNIDRARQRVASCASRRYQWVRRLNDQWPALAVLVLLFASTYLLWMFQENDPSWNSVLRYSYLIPIGLSAWVYGQTAALLISFAVSSLFIPILVRSWFLLNAPSAAAEWLTFLFLCYFVALAVSSLADDDRRRHKLVDTVERLGATIERSSDLNGLLPEILRQSIALCDADCGEIVLLQEKARTLVVKVDHGQTQIEQSVGDHAAASQTLFGWLLARNKVTRLSDLADDARFILPAKASKPRPALLAVPLRINRTAMGVLALWRHGRRRFCGEDAEFLRILADKSQLAIENAWLYSKTDQALSRETHELGMLLEASTAFSSTRELDELLVSLSRKLTESVESTQCKICLLTEDNRSLVVRSGWVIRGMEADPQIGRSLPLEDLPWARDIMAQGKPRVFICDRSDIELGEPERSLLFGQGICSVLMMPLTVKGISLGVAVLGEMRSWGRTPFTTEKIDLCWAMARQGALAIQNIQAFDDRVSQGQRIRLILDNVTDGVFSTDPDGHILAFNHAAEKISGYREAEVIGRRCSEVFRGSTEDGQVQCGRDCPLSKIAELGGAGNPIHRKEWLMHYNGSKVLVAHSVAPIVDQNNLVVGVVSVIRDISREEELIRLKSDFISMVSHQLRTPLANISASAELLAGAKLDENTGRQVLQTLNRQCERLSGLVNQVLEASRLESGQVKLTPEPLVLKPLVEETVRSYHSQYPNYSFKIDIPSHRSYVMGDRVSVEVILENLVQNAIKYSPEGGAIAIAAEPRDNGVVVSVADQGVGIPANQIDNVFQRFHRGPNTSTKTHGFGLGLYIARMLVEAQGGSIWVESQVGRGSRFNFTLKKLEGWGEEDTGH